MIQILANSLANASLYTLVALGFSLLYQTERYFNIMLGFTISLGAFTMLFFAESCDLPLPLAVPISVVFASCVGTVISFIVLRLFVWRRVPLWGCLVVSLGIYTILQNVLSLTFGDNTRTVQSGPIDVGFNIVGAFLTGTQLLTILACSSALVGVERFLAMTKLGRAIRGVSSNRELSAILGISIEPTILWAVAIGSALASLGGVLSALDTGMNPFMDFRLLMTGVVVSIIGGVGSYRGLVYGSVLLAFGQNGVAYFIDSKWIDAFAYLILIGFLIWKPLGFGGRRLKKVEI